MNWAYFQRACAALCAWREARGEKGADGSCRDGVRAVIHAIDNRAKKHGKSWAEIVYQKLQFSSMTAPGDPELCLVPKNPDAAFDICLEVADLIFSGGDFDLTEGATHYFAVTIAEPEWAKSLVFIKQIGNHRFYREAA